MSLKSAFFTVVFVLTAAMAILCLAALAGCSNQRADGSPAELGEKKACCAGEAKDCCANNPGKACCGDADHCKDDKQPAAQ